MKIQPMAAPQAAQPSQSSPAQSSRAAAIAILTGGNQPAAQPQQAEAVANPNQVSPEEISAVKPSSQVDETIEQNKQSDIIEDTEDKKPVEDPALTRQFAKLAQQEKALRAKAAQQEQAYKAREAELSAREAKLSQAPNQQIDSSKYVSIDDLKYNALGVLEKAGVTYEQLTQQLLNPVQTDPRVEATIAKLQAKIDELETKTQSTLTTYEQQQEQAYKAAVKQIETDVTALVNKDPSYEAIKHAGAYQDVVELIEKTYHKDGYLLSVEEAAQAVEDYLTEQYVKYSNIGKVKQRISQSSSGKAEQSNPAQSQGQSQNQPKPQPMKTLTNNNSSTRQLSARERALLAFKGEKV